MTDGIKFTISKWDKSDLLFLALFFSAYFVTGTIVLIIVGHIQWGTILLWAMSISFASSIYIAKIARRPKEVNIMSGEFMLLFKNNRERRVSWSMLNGVNVAESTGAIKLGRELLPYPISREAAIGIQEAYLEQTGKAAPVWDGRSPLRR